MAGNRKPRKPGKNRVRTFTSKGALPIIFRGSAEASQILKIMPHADFAQLREGHGTEEHFWTASNYLNWANTIASMVEFSFDPAPTINAAIDALLALHARFKESGQFVFEGDELAVIGEAMTLADDMHDATTRRQHRDALVKLSAALPRNMMGA